MYKEQFESLLATAEGPVCIMPKILLGYWGETWRLNEDSMREMLELADPSIRIRNMMERYKNKDEVYEAYKQSSFYEEGEAFTIDNGSVADEEFKQCKDVVQQGIREATQAGFMENCRGARRELYTLSMMYMYTELDKYLNQSITTGGKRGAKKGGVWGIGFFGCNRDDKFSQMFCLVMILLQLIIYIVFIAGEIVVYYASNKKTARPFTKAFTDLFEEDTEYDGNDNGNDSSSYAVGGDNIKGEELSLNMISEQVKRLPMNENAIAFIQNLTVIKVLVYEFVFNQTEDEYIKYYMEQVDPSIKRKGVQFFKKLFTGKLCLNISKLFKKGYIEELIGRLQTKLQNIVSNITNETAQTLVQGHLEELVSLKKKINKSKEEPLLHADEENTSEQNMEGGNSSRNKSASIKYKGRNYKIRTGPRGGKYILVKGKTIYI